MLSEEHHKAISWLISLESLRDSYQCICSLCNQSVGHSISLVKYTLPLNTAIPSSKEDVHQQVLSGTLGSHFTWAHGSSFLQQPLASLVGPFCTGDAARSNLQSNFPCPPGVDEHTWHFIKVLQFPSPQAHHTHVLAVLWPEDFINHWKKAKEHTLSSPLGLHFGHYKVFL